MQYCFVNKEESACELVLQDLSAFAIASQVAMAFRARWNREGGAGFRLQNTVLNNFNSKDSCVQALVFKNYCFTRFNITSFSEKKYLRCLLVASITKVFEQELIFLFQQEKKKTN